jgi:hypothetical protein
LKLRGLAIAILFDVIAGPAALGNARRLSALFWRWMR